MITTSSFSLGNFAQAKSLHDAGISIEVNPHGRRLNEDEVAELVEFGKMNIFNENVEWNGKVLELNLEFFYTINEPNGIYVNGDMVKLDQDYVEMIDKLQKNYEKFKTKWSKIVASRQKS